ncbi:MAG: TonB-dependent receptor [Bacteroidetes bacterium]|nr:TonB-dependent receptor [Bacteroidota bacterium]
MKLRIHLAIICLIVFISSIHAQTFNLKGYVSDTLNNRRLQFASVIIIRATDSILESYTRTKEDGQFQISVRKPGKYLLMATFPGFADYVDIVIVKEKQLITDFGMIPMISKSHLLNEFVLKQQYGAIKIKGDTTEYMADSFAVREGATVEELLKKLPGIQVNKDGQVTAQGEKVQKIMVDGEEFFTDDPAVVTRSLQAKTVEKVQVFDKKSDQAQFTGIDDGSREKTINLQLKDNMKKGYFGKIEAGGGTDGYYQNQGMINAFKGKRKISAFAIVANTGKMGLGWEDRDKFGGGNNMEFNDDGFNASSINNSDDDNLTSWNGNFNGQGLPSAWTGGLHYSNKWLENKHHLSSNYRFAKQNIETIGNTLSETSLNNTKLYQDQRSNSYNFGQRNRADLLYEWNIDSTSKLKVIANGSYSETKTGSNSNKTNFLIADTLNENTVNMANDITGKTLYVTILYQKRLRKKGRTFSFNIDEGYREQNGSGNLFSTTHFRHPDSTQIIDQQKLLNASTFQLASKLTYTEPLSKTVFLEINYQAGLNNNSSARLSFDKNKMDGKYDLLNDSTSANYDFNYLINTGGSNLRFVFKKFNFSFGGAMSNTYFSQQDNLTAKKNYSFNRSYNNFFPQASFRYSVPGKQMSARFNYSGSTQQPTIDQIQPYVQNSDPTRLTVGNPDLKQAFNHRITLNYNDYKILSGTYSYAGAGYIFTNDAIVRTQTFNPNGQIISRYDNVNGNYSGWLYAGYGKELKKLNMRAGFGLSANIAEMKSYLNGMPNNNQNNSYSFSIDVDYDKEKVCNINYRPTLTYNQNTSNLNAGPTNYWTFENRLEGNVTLPLKFEIGTDIRWYVRQRVAQFDNNNDVLIWNAYLSKKLAKNDQLELRAYVNDILNQNIGFQRFATGNNVTEQNYNTIKRYGLLSLIWNFTKAPKATANSETGIKIKD